MKTFVTLGLKNYEVNTDFPLSIAIAQSFSEQQPNHFNAPPAQKQPMKIGDFIGDTEQGGSCNVSELKLNPHCNGTHTESIAHICDLSNERSLLIGDITLPPLIPCTLISVAPSRGVECSESYVPDFNHEDWVITATQLQLALAQVDNAQLQSLVIRTLPNESSKQWQKYHQDQQPAFFTIDAIRYLNERGVEHIIVDLPSLDRLNDDGKMSAHHTFWQVMEEQSQPTIHSLIYKTITELAFINNDINDGFYFLNLQLTALLTDATPSKPVLYQAQRLSTIDNKASNHDE